MKEIMKSKKTRTFVVALLLIAAIGTSALTLAYFMADTGTVVNAFEAVEVPTEIVETITPDPNNKNVILKNPSIKNLEMETADGANLKSTDAYIRARIVVSPSIVGEGDDEISLQFSDGTPVSFSAGTTQKGWTYDADGYFYYTAGDVAPGASTSTLFDKVVIGKDVKANFDITIYQEAVSSKHFGGTQDATQNKSLENMKAAFAAVDKN